jgi:O-antigen/teichoic acid export membrane protein
VSNLKQQAVKSIKWTTLQTGIVAGTGPVLHIIKARFLVPEEFAYIAIIMIFIGLFKLLENFGISQAVIQRDSLDSEEASSLFIFNIILSLLFGAALYFISPFIASFFSLSKLDYYLKLTSIIVVIGGPSNLFRALLQKNLNFKELSIIDIGRNIFLLGFVTTMLIIGYGVLGVIYGNIIATVLSTFFIIILSFKYRYISIYPYFNVNKLIPFLKFGIYVSGKQILTFFSHRADEVVIGYFLAPEILGIYYFGKHLLEKLRELITSSFGKVLFPVFSKLKNDKDKLSRAYKNISIYIAFLSFPLFVGVAATSHLFIPLIFGEQWSDSVIVVQVFSLVMLFMILTANVSTSLLYSVNKPAIVFYNDLATISIYFVGLLKFAHQGLVAVLITYSIYIIVKTIILQYFANIKLDHTLLSYLNIIKPAVVLSVGMVIIILLFQLFTSTFLNGYYQLIGSIIIGSLSYAAMAYIFERNIIVELKNAFSNNIATS